MRQPRFRIRFLLLASAAALVSSCAGRLPPPANLNPPADLLQRPDKPKISAEALTSEKAYESWRDDVADWGDKVAAVADGACWWLQDAGVHVECRPRPKTER